MENTLRREIGAILGMAVPQKGYRVKMLDARQHGRIQQKQLEDMMMVILEHLEALEDEQRQSLSRAGSTL